MYSIHRPINLRSVGTILRFYSIGRKSHYDILNLHRNCSDKEIKEAFIQLSKEYHPDKNKDSKANEKFVRIVEAYNILGKPSSRAQYDNTTEIDIGGTTHSEYVYKPHVPYNLRNNPRYSYFYENHDKSHDNRYDQKQQQATEQFAKKKVPNIVIIMLCFVIATIGFAVQMIIIRQSFLVHKRNADENSKRIAEELFILKTKAKENGNEKQIRLLMEKIAIASEQNVATADLGQSLANEKK